MQRSTIILLVLLRLAIGWHFLYEGMQKVRSVWIAEKAEKPPLTPGDYFGEVAGTRPPELRAGVPRPFSSGGYFGEAPGPLGPQVRQTVGDPNEDLLARLTVVPRGADAEPAADKAHDRAPPALKKHWEAFVEAYGRHYKFDQQQQKAAEVKLQHGLATLVGWLEYRPAPVLDEVRSRFGNLAAVEVASLNEKEKHAYQAYLDNTVEVKLNADEVKVAGPEGKLTRRLSAAQRLALYRNALAELREASRTRPAAFDKDIDGQRGRAPLKRKVDDFRKGFVADLDGHRKALIASLNQIAGGPEAAAFDRLGGLRQKAEKNALTEKVKDRPAEEPLAALLANLASIETATDGLRPRKPADSDKQKALPLDGPALQQTLTPLLERVSIHVGEVREAGPPAEVKAFLDEVVRETPAAEKAVRRLPEVAALQPAPENQALWRLDWAARWGLTLMGACLLLGLLTRLNCVLAAGFLLMTYLLVPAFPWLPLVGPSEGSYLFVNKNVVELLALLVLATTPSGRWFGVDALLYRIRVMIFGEKKATTPSPER